MSSNGRSYSGVAKVILCEESLTGVGFDCEAFMKGRSKARFVFSWVGGFPPKKDSLVEVVECPAGEFMVSLEDKRRRILSGPRTYFYLHH